MKPDYSQPIYAFSLALPAGAEPPTEIQWMPPGLHTITATQRGKPVNVKVVVNERTPETLNNIVRQIASAGGTKPYFDFNHTDAEASGYPTEFFWGGTDPKTGGVRARVEWSRPGADAVIGRAYQAFSPAFFTNAKGEVVGAPKNMGGLVNEPAFKTIAPLLSRHAGQGQPTEKRMDTEQELAASKTALANATAKIATLEARLAEVQGAEAVKARDAEIKALNDKIVKLETAQQEAAKIEAKSAVAAAAAEGRIPPQDKDLIAHYEVIYASNPTAGKAILANLPRNAALARIVSPGAVDGATAGKAEEAVQEYKAKHGCSYETAHNAVLRARPELFNAK